MKYEIYIDLLFLEDYSITLYGLELVRICFCRTATHRRLFAAAFIKSICFLVLFLLQLWKSYLPNEVWYALIPLFSTGLGIFLAFGFKVWKAPFYFWGGGLFCELMLGGILEGLVAKLPVWKRAGCKPYLIMLTGFLFFLFFSSFLRRLREHEKYYEVIITHGTQIKKCIGLYDTGNHLQEPISGKAVCIVKENCIRGLLSNKDLLHFRVVPYQSIGKKNGILKAFMVDRLVIKTKYDSYIYEKAWLALAEENAWGKDVWEKNTYQVIIHADYINR